MIIARLILFICLICNFQLVAFGSEEDDELPITTDSRIKTYIYSPNEVFLLVLHYGFQSHIEFAKNELVENVTMGDSFAWKITPLANRLFIKPLEQNIRTNMTIITNKRTYQFDIIARELEDEEEEKDLVYAIRFFYPNIKK
jgi:type IV secretion system protein VirB9